MTRLVTTMGGILAGCLCVTSVNAAPLFQLPSTPSVNDNIVLVQDAPPGMWRGYQGMREQRPGYRRGDDGWWYPLAAFAAGALVGGAVAGSGNDTPPPPPGSDMPPPPPEGPRPAPVRPQQQTYRQSMSPDHYAWCAKRYRTYRASDNTYVPYAGVRAQCRSPY